MKKLSSVVAPLFLALIACTLTPTTPTATATLPAPTEAASSLAVQTHELVAEPTFDPLSFTTLDGRSLSWQDMGHGEQALPDWTDDYSGIEALVGGETLLASEHYGDGGLRGWVTVTRDGEEVYRIETGHGSPINALQGFFAYQNGWVLETNDYTDDDPFTGKITVDGVLLNDQEGYEKAFGAQLLAGRLFYFFQKDGVVDAWYDGQVLPLGFDDVPHYRCCSYSVLNPAQYQDMVGFFGMRAGAWYFAQVGIPAALQP